MITIPLAVTSGTELESADFRCVAGEDLTITLTVTDSAGAAVSLAGYSVVLGWEGPAGDTPVRYPVAGDSTGIVSWTFTAQETHLLSRDRARFDVVLESGTARDRITAVCSAYFVDTVTPLPTAVYSGVGVAGLTSVSTLTASTAYSDFPFSATVSPAAQYVYLAWPAAWGNADVTVDGLPAAMGAPQTITVSGVSYKLSQSIHALTATNMDLDAVEDVA
jgi:hypothetical protein